MTVVTIGAGYRLTIPEPCSEMFKEGESVAMSTDEHGRLVIVPLAKIQAALSATFGLWRDRTDLPDDGVEYVDQLRGGRRLNALADAA